MKLGAALVILACALAGEVNAIEHIVEYILPRGADRGETVKVHLYGIHLKDPAEIVFYKPGIRCVAIDSKLGEHAEGGFGHGGKTEGYVAATFEIAKDCPLGEHVLRLRTRTLLAEPVTFWVGPFPTVDETETKRGENDAPARAQIVPLNSTVNGRILPGDDLDRDCFAVDVKKGGRIAAELEAVRLGTQHLGGENDCQLRLLAPDGRELARCDDTALLIQDPFITFIAPQDGRYVVEVSQQMHTPGERCLYRLHLGNFARPTSAYPLGGQPGEKLVMRLQGDAIGPANATVTLPAIKKDPGELDTFAYFPSEGGVFTPSPLKLRVTSHPNVLEAEGQNTPKTPQRFTIPAALNGIIATDGEVDQWRFHATKGDRLDVRVFARTLGTPLDPKVSIRSAESAADAPPLVEEDDASLADRGYWSCHTRLRPKDLLDPAFTFQAPATGDYVLGIEDTRGIGGPEHIYRIEIGPHRDGLHPFVNGQFSFKIQRSVAFVVPQDNRWTLNVSLGEGVGTKFKGDVELEAIGLPPGVTMFAPRYTQGLRQMPVQFAAAANAKPGVNFIQLVARAVDKSPLNGTPQQGLIYCDRRGGFAWHNVMVDRFALAVVDPAPVRLECSTSAVSLARNGEVTLDLRIVRKAGWDEALELQTDWLPPGVEKGPPVVVKPGQSTAQLRLRATAQAMSGTWPVTVVATTLDGDVLSGTGCRLVTTPVIALNVSEPYLAVNFQRTAIERSKRGEMIAELKHNKPFPGKASATLLRLPHGVKMLEPAPQISATDKTAVFKLEVTADALVGQYKEITAEIAIVENGQTIRQQSGSGVLRVDPSRGSK